MKKKDRLRVLVVDDERAILRFLKPALEAHQYTVLEAETGAAALVAAATHHPDLIILDLGLPDMEGAEVTRRLREWTKVPILILSVREQETVKIEVLDAGADDYLTKPFGMGELLARLRATLRRTAQPDTQPRFEVGALVVDLTLRLVTLNQQELALTPTEYDLLRILIQNVGKVLTHHQLLRQVWGPGYENELHLLRVNVSNLRRKIEADPSRPRYIVTEPGVGYRLRG